MTTTTEDSAEIDFARNAARTALPFADQLAGQYSHIASSLRNGQDQDALAALGASTEDMEHFLTFLVLIRDLVAHRDPTRVEPLRDYQERIVGILEGLQPALGVADLVEVADAIEDDLVPSLRDYRDLDDVVQTALSIAA